MGLGYYTYGLNKCQVVSGTGFFGNNICSQSLVLQHPIHPPSNGLKHQLSNIVLNL